MNAIRKFNKSEEGGDAPAAQSPFTTKLSIPREERSVFTYATSLPLIFHVEEIFSHRQTDPHDVSATFFAQVELFLPISTMMKLAVLAAAAGSAAAFAPASNGKVFALLLSYGEEWFYCTFIVISLFSLCQSVPSSFTLRPCGYQPCS